MITKVDLREDGVSDLRKFVEELESRIIGLFYCVRFPDKWTIIRCDPSSSDKKVNYNSFWRNTVSFRIAEEYSRGKNQVLERLIYMKISSKYLAFPRGKICKQGNKYTVVFGNDLPVCVSKSLINDIFNLREPSWVFDEHEKCVEFDKKFIKDFLKIKENW